MLCNIFSLYFHKDTIKSDHLSIRWGKWTFRLTLNNSLNLSEPHLKGKYGSCPKLPLSPVWTWARPQADSITWSLSCGKRTEGTWVPRSLGRISKGLRVEGRSHWEVGLALGRPVSRGQAKHGGVRYLVYVGHVHFVVWEKGPWRRCRTSVLSALKWQLPARDVLGANCKSPQSPASPSCLR